MTIEPDYHDLGDTVAATWPLHPGPGYRTDPRYDQQVAHQLRGGATSPSMSIPYLYRGEPLTRICDECYGVAATHRPHCSLAATTTGKAGSHGC